MMSVDSTTVDSVLDLCQHQHRRIVLGVLAEEQRAVPLEDISKTVRKYNQQSPRTEASEEGLREIDLLLHHVHLSKLVAEGLIHYDPERQVAELIDQSAPVQRILSTLLAADSSLETPMTLS